MLGFLFHRRKIELESARLIYHPPNGHDFTDYRHFMENNQTFHQPWMYYKGSRTEYASMLKKIKTGNKVSFFCRHKKDNALVAIININEPVQGCFQSATLGYVVHQQHARQGYTSEALQTICDYAFSELKLHRLEANIQPKNTASLGLVKQLGFHKEGLSPKYLRIGGKWKDHERWSLLNEKHA